MEIEIAPGHAHHDEAGHAKSRDQGQGLNRLIAVTVAVMSAFIALSKLKDENVVLKMHHAETMAVDTWNHYQAKKLREYQSEVARDQAEVLRTITPVQAAPVLGGQVTHYNSQIAKFQTDEKELEHKARTYEEDYERLHSQHEWFDLSDSALSIALAMLAVTALTRQKWLLAVSWGLAVLGMAFSTMAILHLALPLAF